MDEQIDTDDWREFKRIKNLEKESRRTSATDQLTNEGIEFEVKGFGIHLVVEGKHGKIDFWPGTTKWIDRSGGKGYGIARLISRIKRSPTSETTT